MGPWGDGGGGFPTQNPFGAPMPSAQAGLLLTSSPLSSTPKTLVGAWPGHAKRQGLSLWPRLPASNPNRTRIRTRRIQRNRNKSDLDYLMQNCPAI